jgi:hypothetical protein
MFFNELFIKDYCHISVISQNNTVFVLNQKKSNSTGKGMRINKQIFELLEELYRYKIKSRVENLNNNKTFATGTRIVLELPGKKG